MSPFVLDGGENARVWRRRASHATVLAAYQQITRSAQAGRQGGTDGRGKSPLCRPATDRSTPEGRSPATKDASDVGMELGGNGQNR